MTHPLVDESMDEKLNILFDLLLLVGAEVVALRRTVEKDTDIIDFTPYEKHGVVTEDMQLLMGKYKTLQRIREE